MGKSKSKIVESDLDDFIELLKHAKIELLSDISSQIQDIIDDNAGLKVIDIPDVSDNSCVSFISWNEFREKRLREINKSLHRQSLEGFPMAWLDLTHEMGCFKIIQDDCYDMIKVLRNVISFTPFLLQNLFSGIDEIQHRYYYSLGCYDTWYGRKIIYEDGPGTMSRELGETTIQRSIEVLAKYGGIDGYENLPRGKKHEVRNAIKEKLNLKDPRHVYNILNKIKNSPKTT